MVDVPVNPEGIPEGGQPPQEEAPGIPKLITEVGSALDNVVDVFTQTGAPPEVLDIFKQASDLYSQGVQLITGGGSPEAVPADSGNVPV